MLRFGVFAVPKLYGSKINGSMAIRNITNRSRITFLFFFPFILRSAGTIVLAIPCHNVRRSLDHRTVKLLSICTPLILYPSSFVFIPRFIFSDIITDHFIGPDIFKGFSFYYNKATHKTSRLRFRIVNIECTISEKGTN